MPKHKAKIKIITRGRIVDDGSEFLEAHLEIKNGKDVVEVRKFAYPLETTEEEITADLEKFMATYESDIALAAETKVSDKLNTKAEKTIQGLTGKQII